LTGEQGWPDGLALLPHPGELLAGLLPMLLLAGLVVLVVVRSRRPRLPAYPWAASTVGEWNAQVIPDGSLPASGERGTIRVENGWLGFHPGGASQPSWIVPAAQVRAGKNSVLSTAEVWLESAATGRLLLSVSHEHIDVFVGNQVKDLRERRTADELLWLLAQSGALVVGG
jgi:hypothetical protein